MTCHVGRALEEIILLQILHHTIVEKMSGFICRSEFGKLVAGQGTPAVEIEGVGDGAIHIL